MSEDLLAGFDRPFLEALAKAEREGWAEINSPISRLAPKFERLGLTPVPARSGEPSITILRPRASESAPPRSLSAQHGVGAFPLHTDGAHLEQVPDFVLLEAATPGEGVPTLLKLLDFSTAWRASNGAMTQGMFLVSNGADSFYAPFYDAGFRYDPGCMTPADYLAENVVDCLAELLTDPTPYEWDGPGKTLIIANRHILHGRGDASEAESRELTRVMLRKEAKA